MNVPIRINRLPSTGAPPTALFALASKSLAGWTTLELSDFSARFSRLLIFSVN
jgi:hypothetical protein